MYCPPRSGVLDFDKPSSAATAVNTKLNLIQFLLETAPVIAPEAVLEAALETPPETVFKAALDTTTKAALDAALKAATITARCRAP